MTAIVASRAGLAHFTHQSTHEPSDDGPPTLKLPIRASIGREIRALEGQRALVGRLADLQWMTGQLLYTTPELVFVFDDAALRVEAVSRSVCRRIELTPDELVGRPITSILAAKGLAAQLERARTGDVAVTESDLEARLGAVEVSLRVTLSHHPGAPGRFVLVGVDLARQHALEVELRQAQKLEAVGQLSAGVAHEINTPIQFVGDSIAFLRDAFTDVLAVIDRARTAEEADLEYLRENVPAALERCDEGIGRVAEIVRALKEIAHPDPPEKVATDLNRLLESATTVARNETKLVADVVLELGTIPQVECHAGGIAQVILNLVVNASHAIGDRNRAEHRARGTIRVATALVGDHVRLSVSDDGTGIPEKIRHRMFEPFFTTKAVGIGTGQGLALARSIVCDRHQGQLTCETELGRGTTFHVLLPLPSRARTHY